MPEVPIVSLLLRQVLIPLYSKTEKRPSEILCYGRGFLIVEVHCISFQNFNQSANLIVFPISSSCGAMLYSVGDHVLPYSTVLCCFQDFNHLACSQPVGKSIGHLLSLFPSAAFSFHHSCCYEMF